jgi:hypothetical protein
MAWAAGEQRWTLSSTELVPPSPFETRPLTVHAERGTTTAVSVPALVRRGVVATLTGHLEPASGLVQVAGEVAPTGARDLRQVAAPVIDDGSAHDATPAALVAERLRFAPRRRRTGTVRSWLQMLPEAVVRDHPIGELPPEERLAVLALAAVAGGAVAVVVDAGDLGPDALDRLSALLDLVVDGDRAAVIVTSPTDRAATRLGAAPTRREVSA